jgi:DNA-binding transcriptional LysR family regulator
MQVQQIAAFLAVARHLSFRRAAEDLHLSQSAVSERIRELERDVGSSLFIRDRSGTALTEAGLRLLPAATRAAEDIAAIRAAVRGELRRPTLTLGLMPAGVGPRTWPLIAQFARTYPDVELRILTVGFADALPRLNDGNVDVVLAIGPFTEESGETTTVGATSLVAIMANWLPQAGDDRIDPDWLAGRIKLKPPPQMGEEYQRFWTMHDRAVRRSSSLLVVPDAGVPDLQRMIHAGTVGLWPQLVSAPDTLTVLPLEEPRQAPLQLVTRHRPSPEAAQFTRLGAVIFKPDQPRTQWQ